MSINQYLANLSLSFDPPPSSSHLKKEKPERKKRQIVKLSQSSSKVEPLSHRSWLTWTIYFPRRLQSQSWKPGKFTLVRNIAQLQRHSNIPVFPNPLDRRTNGQSKTH